MERGKSNRVINIIGRSVGYEDAPRNIESWGVNIVLLRRKVDIGFDMHEAGKMNKEQVERRRQIIPWVTSQNIPVYSTEAIPGTTYIRYPIEKVVQRFNTGFFSNAFCYMIALALIRGVDQLNFYGAAFLKHHKKYYEERSGVNYWIGIAEGMGVKTYIHGDYCELRKTEDGLAYGYELSAKEMIEKYGN